MNLLAVLLLVLLVLCVLFAAGLREFCRFRRDLGHLRGQVASLRHDRALDRKACDDGFAKIVATLEEIWLTTEAIKEQVQTLGESADAATKDAGEILDDLRDVLDTLPALRDSLRFVEDAVRRIDSRAALIENIMKPSDTSDTPAPAREDEMNKLLEEGVMNILNYAAGKVPGVEVGLG